MGEDPASEVYVNAKVRKCAELGFHSEKVVLSKDASQDEVLVTVKRLNEDASIHGILVQSPPPSQIDEEEIVRTIDPAKEVDGFHPENAFNKFFQGQGRSEGEYMWIVPADAPDELYYQCEIHPVMFGKIIIVD